jgi:hypothetical protein
VIPALGRQGQEDLKFQDSLVYIVRPCLNKKKKKKKMRKIPHKKMPPGQGALGTTG